MPSLKPPRWSWNRSLLEPRFQELARGLTFLVPFWDGDSGLVSMSQLRSLVGGHAVTGFINQPTWFVSKHGIVAGRGSAGTSQIQYDDFETLTSVRSEASAFMVVNENSDAIDNGLMGISGLAFLWWHDATNKMTVRVGSTNYVGTTGAWSAPDDDYHTVGFSFANGSGIDNVSGFVDGVSVLSATPTTDFVANSNPFILGAADATRANNNQYAIAAVWDRYLTQQEQELLATDPFGLLRPALLETVTVGTPQIVSIGAATESESAQQVIPLKPIITSISGTSESELAQTILPVKSTTANIGSAVESEVAQPITALQASKTPVGAAVESEVANIVTALKPIITPIVGASESNLAGIISIINASLISIGAAVESEIAELISPIKPIIKPIGSAIENEFAQIVNILSLHKIIGTVELELAQALVINRLALIGFASESELAQIIGAPIPPTSIILDSNNPNRIYTGTRGRIYVNVDRRYAGP